jgi:hypothetical protein
MELTKELTHARQALYYWTAPLGKPPLPIFFFFEIGYAYGLELAIFMPQLSER